MAFDPSPLDLVSRTRHHMVEGLPKFDVFNRLLGRCAPALGFPAMDPFGDAFANIFAVEEQGDLTWALEGLEPLDHSSELHAVVGGAQLAAKKFVHMLARLQQNAPAAGAWVAFAGAIGVNNNVVQEMSFVADCGPMGESERTKGTAVAAGDRTVRQRRPSSNRPPGTRLMAKIR